MIRILVLKFVRYGTYLFMHPSSYRVVLRTIVGLVVKNISVTGTLTSIFIIILFKICLNHVFSNDQLIIFTAEFLNLNLIVRSHSSPTP